MRLGALLGMLVVAAGCGAQFEGRDGSAHPDSSHERWVHYYMLGLVGEDDIDLRYYCRSGALRVERGATFGTLALSVVTLGIYTPRKMWVTCAAEAPRAPETSPPVGQSASSAAPAKAPRAR